MAASAELLLDTGALVACLHRDDRDHERCVRVLERLRGPLLTTEPVLTEAMFLLSRVRRGPAVCLDFFVRGGAVLVPQSNESLRRCAELIRRYASLPMDFADATLVALAEETGIRRVFTLDRRDFGVYRVGARGLFEILPV